MPQLHRVAVLAGIVFTLGFVQPARPVAPEPAGVPGLPPVLCDSGAAAVQLFGESGHVRAIIAGVDSVRANAVALALLPSAPLAAPGVYPLALAAPDGKPFVVLTLQPLTTGRAGRVDAYRVGHWPSDALARDDARYAPPRGYLAVTPELAALHVSTRFRLGDFLTHDQRDVWPKVLVLRTPLVDKLELVADALQRRGLPSVLHVMSGFRTPQYNALGVGVFGGRARDSRHMYGDAADVFVDANGDGMMDDLDGDGRVTVGDARVLFAVAESVESAHPRLIGGLSAYQATSAHGPFVHIDTRGRRARW